MSGRSGAQWLSTPACRSAISVSSRYDPPLVQQLVGHDLPGRHLQDAPTRWSPPPVAFSTDQVGTDLEHPGPRLVDQLGQQSRCRSRYYLRFGLFSAAKTAASWVAGSLLILALGALAVRWLWALPARRRYRVGETGRWR